MLFALNIGNTNVSMGVFEKDDLITSACASVADGNRLAEVIHGLIAEYKPDIRTVAIAGVNPPLLDDITGLFREQELLPVIVGRDITIPIDNLTDEPEKVGTDRLLNALAAFRRFDQPVMIVDAGTATTIDVADRFGRFLGGAIAPGPRTALDALHKSTAALPHVSLGEAKSRLTSGTKEKSGLPEIGKNTQEAMIAGVAWSLIGAIESLRAVYERSVGPVKVVGTGGAIDIIPRELDIFDARLPHLTLEGIAHTVG